MLSKKDASRAQHRYEKDRKAIKENKYKIKDFGIKTEPIHRGLIEPIPGYSYDSEQDYKAEDINLCNYSNPLVYSYNGRFIVIKGWKKYQALIHSEACTNVTRVFCDILYEDNPFIKMLTGGLSIQAYISSFSTPVSTDNTDSIDNSKEEKDNKDSKDSKDEVNTSADSKKNRHNAIKEIEKEESKVDSRVTDVNTSRIYPNRIDKAVKMFIERAKDKRTTEYHIMHTLNKYGVTIGTKKSENTISHVQDLITLYIKLGRASFNDVFEMLSKYYNGTDPWNMDFLYAMGIIVKTYSYIDPVRFKDIAGRKEFDSSRIYANGLSAAKLNPNFGKGNNIILWDSMAKDITKQFNYRLKSDSKRLNQDMICASKIYD